MHAPKHRVFLRLFVAILLPLLPAALTSDAAADEALGACRGGAAGANDRQCRSAQPTMRSERGERPAPGRYEYCVVGAGPGGLQVASMLVEANVTSVVVFDKAPRAGSFFAKFPIHRRLISINKKWFNRARRWSHPEFQLRHDWNSLISLKGGVMPGLRFGDFTDEYYPHADVLVRYLQAFADAKLPHHVAYDTRVTSVVKKKVHAHDARDFFFEVDAITGGGDATTRVEERWTCRRIIVATGLSKPNRLPADLHSKDVISYHELEENPRRFLGQRVAVFGGGNAAFEAAASISRVSAHVDLWIGGKTKLAWQTHYPGAVRVPNSGILDQYQLKSLDNILEGVNFWDYNLTNVSVTYEDENDAGEKRMVNATELRVHPKDPVPVHARPWKDRKWGPYGLLNPHTQETHPETGMPLCSTSTACFAYDAVVCALGWHFDKSIFEKRSDEMMKSNMMMNSIPRLNFESENNVPRNDKYPAMTAHYESTNVNGMFFAGSAAHARDYRRAAGGFIHGFRYTAQALVRDLLRRYHGQPWPSRILASKSASPWPVPGLEDKLDDGAVVKAVMARMNVASSMYQMYKEIVDVSFKTEKGYAYYEDVPIAMLMKDYDDGEVSEEGDGESGDETILEEDEGMHYFKHDDEMSMDAEAGNVLHPHRPQKFFTLGMEWGKGFYGPEVLHHHIDPRRQKQVQLFLHPVLRAYKSVRNKATNKLTYSRYAVVHLFEDLATDFTHPHNHLELVKAFFADPVKAEKDQVIAGEAAYRKQKEYEAERDADFKARTNLGNDMDEVWETPPPNTPVYHF